MKGNEISLKCHLVRSPSGFFGPEWHKFGKVMPSTCRMSSRGARQGINQGVIVAKAE